ncbi:MFS transporter- SP family- general alpha glucoside:H+ symporter [Apiospora aurea]|uniref:MFS transporter- SP family- general alpha glucoside:H+ symporter n=1 Tax=Apiospora aurea TaxID=335848 RepID=A0ABR1Q7K4_9PEZI
MTDRNQPSENAQDGSGDETGAGRNVRLRDGAEEISQAPPTYSTTARRRVEDAEKHPERPQVRAGPQQSVQIDPAVARKIAANVDDFMTLVHEADAANERERDMKLSTAFKIYPKAIAWSAVLSSCLVMEGYDTSIVGSYFAYPVFKNKFGEPAPNGDMVISAAWQNGIQGATNVGEIIGLQIAGWVSERYGYRWTIISALIAITGFIFFPFFAESLVVFLVGEFFQGLSWGVFQTMTTAYAAEVCPVPLRHYLTAYVNLCWIMGGFISSGVLVGLVDRQDEWGYKIPFALQWIWPIPIAIGCYLAPESPWWCVRRGHKDRAERSLKRLARREGFSQRDADAAMALMIYTDEMEKQVATGTTYWDCFRGLDLRRTEIVCMTWMAQTMAGGAISGLSAFFFQQAGISAADSFKLGWGQNALGAVGTMASWLILTKVGRKTLMFWGMAAMFVLLLITGFMGIHTPPSTAEAWTAGTMVVLLTAVSNFSVGPVVYTIVSEIPSTRLRAKSIILARNAYNAINIAFVNVLSYRQVTPAEWNWGPKAAFFWAGMNAIFTTYIFFRLPETQGRTYAELDILFENKIPARKFASTKIDTLAKGTEGAQKEQADRLAAPAGSMQEYT